MRKLILALLSLALTSSVGAQSCCDKEGLKRITDTPSFYYPGNNGNISFDQVSSGSTTLTTDAAGEMAAMIGRLFINGRPTSAKNCTAAGGCSITWRSGTVSGFAGADDSISVGIQDVSAATAPTQPDETFGVSGTHVGNVNPPSNNAVNTTDMDTDGDDTAYSHGDLIAIVWNLSACNGCSVVESAAGNASTVHLPTSALKTAGTWGASGLVVPNAIITFDDGTLGWIDGGAPMSSLGTQSFKSDDATDEYGQVFTVPFTMRADALYCQCAAGTNGDAELILYSGTDTSSPTAMATVSIDDKQWNAANATARFRTEMLSTPVILRPGVEYGVMLRPTSANNVTIARAVLGAAAHRAAWGGGTSSSGASRADQTGAFSKNTVWFFPAGVRASAVLSR